jgi:hypothetical protein
MTAGAKTPPPLAAVRDGSPHGAVAPWTRKTASPFPLGASRLRLWRIGD